MRERQLTDEAHVTHVDLSPLMPVMLLLIVGLGALVGFAMAGNKTAELILVALAAAAFITLGIVLGNSVRRSNAKSRSTEAEIEQETWRLNQEENLALLDQQAKVQANLALGAHRTTRQALTAAQGQTSEEEIPAIVVGSEVYDDIS